MAFKEHTALIAEATDEQLTRHNNKLGDGVHAIMCGSVLHRIQFTKSDTQFKSLGLAKTWLKENNYTALSTEAAKAGQSMLTFDLQGAKAFDAITGVDNSGDLPKQTFLKDMIQVGKYIHPVEGWELEVDEERMDRWIAASLEMEKNGVKVEVNKDHSFKADDAFGEVHGLFRRPNDKGIMTLYGQHTIIGQDGIELAQKVPRVSIWIEPALVDGMGRFYGEAIIHSSIVQQPVVPDQQGFVKIAASNGRTSMAASLRLSNNGAPTMDLTPYRELLGLGDDVELTEDNLLEKVGDHVKALSTKNTELGDKVTELDTKVNELTTAMAASNKKIDVDPDALDMMADGMEMKVDALVEKGHVTPKAASMLKNLIVGTPDARPVMALSRKACGGAEPWGTRLIAALEESKPVDLKQHTNAQVLSRQTPGTNDDDTGADASTIAQMAGVTKEEAEAGVVNI